MKFYAGTSLTKQFPLIEADYLLSAPLEKKWRFFLPFFSKITLCQNDIVLFPSTIS